jgi:hypothetical protein
MDLQPTINLIEKVPQSNSFSRIWGSHGGGYEEFYLLRYNSLQSIKSNFNGLHGVTFQKIKVFKTFFIHKHSLLAVFQQLTNYSFNYAKFMHVVVVILVDSVAYFCRFLADVANNASIQC